MDAHLRAGIAVYNAGHYHAAHDAWEDHWLDCPEGERKDFLQGLIQFTAAVHHTARDNWEGARGLAESALGYLDGLGETYEGVDLAGVRPTLETLATAPETVDPPALTHRGAALSLADLGFEATAVAAGVLAEALGYDETTIEQAVTYAREDIAAGEERSPFVTLTFDFVRGGAGPDGETHRGIVAQRLGEHVRRRQRRESDVDGLF